MALGNYFVFRGRAGRKEFWYFLLGSILLGVSISYLENYFFEVWEPKEHVLLVPYILLVLVPFLSAAVRRSHDIGKSGWSLFIYFVPLIGGVLLITRLATEGDRFANKYGPGAKSNEELLTEFGEDVSK